MVEKGYLYSLAIFHSTFTKIITEKFIFKIPGTVAGIERYPSHGHFWLADCSRRPPVTASSRDFDVQHGSNRGRNRKR